MTTAVPATVVRRARLAVVVAFGMNGLAFASFISRMPSVRADLGLTTGELGLLLLCLSGASVSGISVSGLVVARFGPGRAVLGGAVSVGTGLALLGVGLVTGTVFAAGIGLGCIGAGSGIWDVAMNVEGADVERRLGRSLLPKLHAAFSIGTVAGAGLGALTAGLGVPLWTQVLVIAVLTPVSALWATRRFLGAAAVPEPVAGPHFGLLDAWREPRTVIIGLMVLGFAFIEGSANDWMAVALVDGYRAPEAVGAIAFGCFVTAMTVGRFVGGSLLDRFGRVVVLRSGAALALVGLALVLLGPAAPVALVGALCWGLGAALGFPVGMSAAADDPARAAARVSTVGAVGYVAFLAGPPLIGPLAQQAGILRALLVVVAAILLALLCSASARPLSDVGKQTSPTP